jgi:hypothetical protein
MRCLSLVDKQQITVLLLTSDKRETIQLSVCVCVCVCVCVRGCTHTHTLANHLGRVLARFDLSNVGGALAMQLSCSHVQLTGSEGVKVILLGDSAVGKSKCVLSGLLGNVYQLVSQS